MSLNDTPTPDEAEVGASAQADPPVDAQPTDYDDTERGDEPVAVPNPEVESVVSDESEVTAEEAAEEAHSEPVDALEAEVAELRDQLIRARADYDNLNKRRVREVAEARDRGAAALAANLVDVLDSFEMALAAAEQSNDEQMAKGVQLVHNQLLNALKQSGLEAVPGVGSTFDPNIHEAVHAEEDDQDREVPEVIDVLRTGWMYKGQLLRAATVRVIN
ncbi:nucleotide exchange factor GrpE [Stomatohabitans albus]|uniref:nucleotide exchange factor GrpE n=1 Tax=Stomatohabitans albus TaxID=3110766 RepID=UPI00300D9675